MRITRDLLLNAASDFVTKSVKNDRSVTAVYLTGSLLAENPLLGGTTDIDLVFVHDNKPVVNRDIFRFTDDITLDIYHHELSLYDQPRLLRVDPTLGPPINSTRIILHDTQHWFEYTQAIITAQFNRAEYHAERIHKLASAARAEWWRLEGKLNASPKEMSSFIKVIEQGTNAIACISGMPLTGRRFIFSLAERCQTVGSPHYALDIVSLLGFSNFDFSSLGEWINRWESILFTPDNPSKMPLEIHPYRKLYYLNAVRSYFSDGQLESCLWIMLYTWTTLANILSSHSAGVKEYNTFLSALGFKKGSFHEKVHSLDALLDTGDDIINRWALETGA